MLMLQLEHSPTGMFQLARALQAEYFKGKQSQKRAREKVLEGNTELKEKAEVL